MPLDASHAMVDGHDPRTAADRIGDLPRARISETTGTGTTTDHPPATFPSLSTSTRRTPLETKRVHDVVRCTDPANSAGATEAND